MFYQQIKRIDQRLAHLSPAYFTLVMGTGVISISAGLLHVMLLAKTLLWLNVIFYAVLWLLNFWRLYRYAPEMLADFSAILKGSGFLTMVAATAVLGSQLIILENDLVPATILLGMATLLYLALNYGLLARFVTHPHKPGLAEGISGGWLLHIIAPQSIAVLILLLDARCAFLPRAEFDFIALSLWLLGGMLYIWVMTLIFYRMIFMDFIPEHLHSSYWSNMGAMAISTLAGSLLVLNGESAPYLQPLLPFIKGFTLFYWAGGSWWIPLLLILGFWRYGIRKFPLRYDASYWAMVFPVGMYGLATLHMARSMHLVFLDPLGRVFFFLALTAWSLTFLAMLYSILQGFRK